jgi:hypothetical protein
VQPGERHQLAATLDMHATELAFPVRPELAIESQSVGRLKCEEPYSDRQPTIVAKRGDDGMQ